MSSNGRLGYAKLAKACLNSYLTAREHLGPDSNVKIAIMGDDPTRFVFKIDGISGDHDEFKGGQYIGLIWQDSLTDPPQFKIYTPNGVIECNTAAICTSISKYHPQNYRPELGIYGFISSMMGAIQCWETTKHGIGMLYDGNLPKQIANIRKFAKASKAYNTKYHADVLAAFDSDDLDDNIAKQLEQVKLDNEKTEHAKEEMKSKLAVKKSTRTRPTRKPIA